MINADLAALEFLVDAGVTQAYTETPNNRLKPDIDLNIFTPDTDAPKDSATDKPVIKTQQHSLTPHSEIIEEARKIAASCNTLEELKSAIQAFDGLDVKKTATQIVFADGNPSAKVMIIGEAPGADEDRQGKPFVGVSGQLLDKIMACIGLSRESQEPDSALYISNILNWRPPGNRTPTEAEMEIAFPFIQKHIALIKPQILILCGGVAAQTILQSKESISRLRNTVYDYDDTTRAVATYHPAFLLRTPLQKRKVWEDMLRVDEILHG